MVLFLNFLGKMLISVAEDLIQFYDKSCMICLCVKEIKAKPDFVGKVFQAHVLIF